MLRSRICRPMLSLYSGDAHRLTALAGNLGICHEALYIISTQTMSDQADQGGRYARGRVA